MILVNEGCLWFVHSSSVPLELLINVLLMVVSTYFLLWQQFITTLDIIFTASYIICKILFSTILVVSSYVKG